MKNKKSVEKLGYTFEIDGKCSYGNQFAVIAKDKKGKEIGFAEFYNGGTSLFPQDVHVSEKHRRKGIATALYKEAQHATLVKIEASENQSEEAMLFWAQPNRPFGN